MKKVAVKMRARVPATIIIEAFLNKNMLRDWWGVEKCLIERKIGGIYILAWHLSDKGFGYVNSGVIHSYKPESELTISNFVYMNPQKEILGPMTLTIKATDIGSSYAEFYICQDGYQSTGDWDWYYEAVSGAWPVVAKNLKEYVESLA